MSRRRGGALEMLEGERGEEEEKGKGKRPLRSTSQSPASQNIVRHVSLQAVLFRAFAVVVVTSVKESVWQWPRVCLFPVQ
jgi:hypothetical protein